MSTRAADAPGQGEAETLQKLARLPEVRTALTQIITVDPQFQALRARIAARRLDSLPAGSRVLLSGCGEVSRQLVESHPQSLARHDLAFTDGAAERPEGFLGQRWLTAGDAVAFDPEHAFLLTATYETAMRQRLEGLPAGRIATLREILRAALTEADILECLEHINTQARNTARALREAFPADEKTLYLPDSDWYGANLLVLRTLRERGWRVVMVVRANTIANLNAQALTAEGFADHVFLSPSAEYSTVFSLCLCATFRFSAVVLWVLYANVQYVQSIIRHSLGPVIAQYDSFLETMLDDERFAAGFYEKYGTTREEALEAERNIITSCGGMLYRNEDHVIRYFEDKYGSRKPKHKFLRAVDAQIHARNAQVRKYSADSGELHIAFINSIQFADMITEQVAFPLFCIYEFVEACASQGIHLSIFNPEDFGAVPEFDGLRRMAAASKYISYTPAIPSAELMALLPRFDFGWMCRRIDTVRCEFPRVHLPHTIFTYLSAAVPFIVGPETRYMADIARENGIGLVLETADWPQASGILRGFDREQYLRNAGQYIEGLAPELLGKRLAAFLDSIAAR
ncbi:MAG TPA: hypothetical protein VN419_00970 [Humidesulfovibrio sp.]|uniref:hypothetical protein n=1 Tax=Humidesulfovibrio sp. TaxID=2910988 RepID=UPI002C0943D8|nr:hypothetical protein [Humidesulfovibrio sp.]HWR02560.1 hypothetical protein [Humidesulfovibrio sp.]